MVIIFVKLTIKICVNGGVTLTSDEFDSHAGMLMPVNRVKLDETRDDRFIEV